MTEEPDDEQTPRLPPDPLDRVWFHPSELGPSELGPSELGPSGLGDPAPALPSRRSPWGFALAGALCGVAATLGVLGATGVIGSGDGGAPGSGDLAPVFARLQRDHAASLVAGAAPSVVAVQADGVVDGSGSGVAFGTERVVTSAALVSGATVVRITTARGRVVPAIVAGADPETDLALLRTDGAHLPTARLGSADGLAVGTWVLAVGAAGGNRHWASQGVVSGIRDLVPRADGAPMPGMLGTDVAMVASAGGGALLDDEGAVVAILSRAAPGHAMPVDVAREVAEQLGTAGRVRHPWLGVDTLDAGARVGGGATVQTVAPDGPGERAGLSSGDVITELGDDRVSDAADLLAAVARRRPGDPVELTVWRADHQLRRSVTLAERPS